MQLNGDRELRLRNVGVRRGLVELRRAAAVAADGQLAERMSMRSGSICAPE
jgi:hypothetical protein